jgi:hypothetical protein
MGGGGIVSRERDVGDAVARDSAKLDAVNGSAGSDRGDKKVFEVEQVLAYSVGPCE